MIKSFGNKGTEDIFNGLSSKEARQVCPSTLWRIAARKLDLIDSASILSDLKSPPGNPLERLQADRKGEYSIRINDQYRICFNWTDQPEKVEIIDYHT